MDDDATIAVGTRRDEGHVEVVPSARSWLTMVCDSFLAEVGGLEAITKRLGSDTTHLPVAGGTLFKIGSKPTISDRERGEHPPEYAKLHTALRPLIERAHDQAMWFASDDSDTQAERCEAWFRRFET